MSHTIEKHSNSLVAAAKIAAAEQERNCNQSRGSEVNARINLLRDTRREMTLCMTSPNVINNQLAFDAIVNEIQGIDEEIETIKEELHEILATPTIRAITVLIPSN